MKVGIIALGWLGKQLAQAIKEEGHEVVGSYAHAPKGIEGEFRYDINNDQFPRELKDCDLVIFNLPPSKIESIEVFHSFLKNISSRFIFISSTSVYGQKGVVDENSDPAPLTKSGMFLFESEKLVSELDDFCVIRPGGLYGLKRHPAKFMSGRQITAGRKERVNLISGKAVCDLIKKTLNKSPKIINAVNSHHPLKTEYYNDVCEELGLELARFDITEEEGKVVSTIYKDFLVSTPL